MAIQEQAYADTYSQTGYLYDWARRTGNMGNLANFYVEIDQDGSTGRPIFRVRDIADQAGGGSFDPAAPTVINVSAAGDTNVAAEDKSDA